ncbi:MAG TPA: YeeE/YedE family protein [Novosphingobium sp.]|nr:YeeE/YedE family protein [Novosphingobium sp.]HZV08713.1 YeeE/YedE family protein [Novosphingobium sp.]
MSPASARGSTSTLAALGCGLLFGAGLLLSGMTSPARVLGFLDITGQITGQWDPSLAFVMGGALAVAAPLFALARRRGAALNGRPLADPASRLPDARLLAGAALFGLGWGLAGLCPGPALVDLALRPWPALVFTGPMLAGLLLSRRD